MQWHRWFSKYRGSVLWPELLVCFAHSEFEDLSEDFTRLRQITTIEVY